MKTMSIKSLSVICALAVSFAATAAPLVTQEQTVSRGTQYGYDVNVNGPFTPGGNIPANAKDPRYQFVDPLTVYMRTVWPEDVRSVRQAVDYLLEPTGYTLVTRYPAPREAALLVDKPIPPIAKVHRTMPVIDALQMLVGLDNYVVIDHAHRLVSFQKNR
ncbi:pilus assembly protein PilL [Klebsiella pneumoniae]|uniref:pilus assembly protein PilL n=1 Tax=Klebsiella pneumoniae TaxID=573 RepID=UPI0018A4DCA6|nr:pilus assembly protein PilL [Klebsiella pneumoniae]ELE4368164.1 pilus assembly protein PilL [Salmonella enterica]EMD7130173.1 pilus assembly protein PilL [Salmonella enterica]MDE8392902.1 pilus assembly protein PilL [Klebsiella pneumoniae]BBW89495.1 hypothetical protein THOKLE017_P30320 [Klebsiella pneumoniae]HBU8764005.1 pilus assembly protein PilL [Klebsiella pneumoniae]